MWIRLRRVTKWRFVISSDSLTVLRTATLTCRTSFSRTSASQRGRWVSAASRWASPCGVVATLPKTSCRSCWLCSDTHQPATQSVVYLLFSWIQGDQGLKNKGERGKCSQNWPSIKKKVVKNYWRITIKSKKRSYKKKNICSFISITFFFFFLS